MSQHQELLNVLLEADEAHKAEGAMWPELADAILADGYRKPQQVTTIEELEALPPGSVVLSLSYLGQPSGLRTVGAARQWIGVLETIAAKEDK